MRTVKDINNIPKELKELKQWVCWKYVRKPGATEATKVPINASNGQYASVNKPFTWATFREAVMFYNHRPDICGIGFVMTGREGIIGIDIDGRVDHELIKMFDSYAELTPSGNGCRIFIKADVTLTDKKKSDIEIYNDLRFFTVTGDRLHDAGINDRQYQFEQFYSGILSNTATKKTNDVQIVNRPAKVGVARIDINDLSDEDVKLLQRIFTYDQFGELNRMRFEGNIPQSDYRNDSKRGSVPDNSLSTYYLTLCFYNWTKDIDTVIRLLRASALYYPKWDEIRNGISFIEEDVNRILDKQLTRKVENFKVEFFSEDSKQE